MLAQTKKELKGVVTDSKGQPAGSVSVNVKGTNANVVTGADGSFTIRVAEGDILVFNAVNFIAFEQTVGKGATMAVTLKEKVGDLNDVVVVGYGKASRKTLTSSISSVKGGDLNRGPISDVGQMLQGKVPGLNISKSGDPNASAAIVLRGASTLRTGAQSPLFVIDGVPGADMSILAPDDIESIDVLKDAAAAAIYGNRAANGVIMVTTKRGKKGALQLNYNGYIAQEKVSNQLKMMNAEQYKSFLAKNNLVLAPENDKGGNTNWQDEVQRSSAISHNHNVSFGSGSENTTYNASVNYFDQQGILKLNGLKRMIARLSIDQKAINDKLKLGLSVTNSVSQATYVPYKGNILAQMLTYLPTAPVKNADGSWYENFNMSSYYNPVAMMSNAEEGSKYSNLLGTFTAQLKLPLGLTYDVNVSYQRFQNVYSAYYNRYFTNNYANVYSVPDPPADPSLVTIGGTNGKAERSTTTNTNKILETYLTWDRKFGLHSINAVVGYSYQDTENGDGFSASSTNFPTDAVSYYNLSLGNPYAVGSFRINLGGATYEHVKLISDFARINYSFNNKYSLQGSIRRDGSNVFGDNNKWGYFPSVGLSWRLDQEQFLKNVTFLSDLKLRASYGVAGNSAGFSPLTTKLIYGTRSQFYNNGVWDNALGAIQNENPDLRWEKTATTNIGIDFGLLKGRVTGSLEWYNKKTTDLIYTFPVSTSLYPSGSLTANVGSMTNKGFEFTLNVTPVVKRDFSWTSSINLAHNQNKLNSLSDSRFQADSIQLVQPDGGGQTGSKIQMILVGQPIGQFFVYKYAGQNANGVSTFYNAKGEQVSDLSKLNPRRDYYLAGNAQPKVILGWNNTFRYKNLDLNIFMRSVLGNKIMNVTRADLSWVTMAQFRNLPVALADESTKDVNAQIYSDRYVESGSYVRLDNATLGYNFKNVSKDIKNIRAYISGNNLFVITGYKGIDPEINQGGIAPGVDARNFYPKTRTILVGVNVSF
ncbi:SusC/RagA family TonB-linked outer membrane protein [Filimonas zeae]|uniref:SusC/RagA family TonB-linked outer membrane protein n=2 Tax=Filimonas zeae TaxID=1737353 RepID=A0A917MXN9_9BACT|nr:SusC/RagA family TonB-linked outer membrane protein [Filimonas zeae]